MERSADHGHIVHFDPPKDNSRVSLSRDLNRRLGQPLHTWLRTVEFESDLAALKIGLATTYLRVPNRQQWITLI